MDAAFEYRRLVIMAGHVDQTEKAWAFSFSPATIVAAKQQPLALITSANGDKLQFAPVDRGLRTVGAPVGDPQYRTDWYKEYLRDKIQPTLDAITRSHQPAASAVRTVAALPEITVRISAFVPYLLTAAVSQPASASSSRHAVLPSQHATRNAVSPCLSVVSRSHQPAARAVRTAAAGGVIDAPLARPAVTPARLVARVQLSFRKSPAPAAWPRTSTTQELVRGASMTKSALGCVLLPRGHLLSQPPSTHPPTLKNTACKRPTHPPEDPY